MNIFGVSMDVNEVKNVKEDKMELGKFYFINKKFELAKSFFLEILEKDETNYDAIYNLALCYEALNDLDNATLYYKRVLSIKEDHKLAKEHLSKIIKLDD